jgi:hypothetical protein
VEPQARKAPRPKAAERSEESAEGAKSEAKPTKRCERKSGEVAFDDVHRACHHGQAISLVRLEPPTRMSLGAEKKRPETPPKRRWPV